MKDIGLLGGGACEWRWQETIYCAGGPTKGLLFGLGATSSMLKICSYIPSHPFSHCPHSWFDVKHFSLLSVGVIQGTIRCLNSNPKLLHAKSDLQLFEPSLYHMSCVHDFFLLYYNCTQGWHLAELGELYGMLRFKLDVAMCKVSALSTYYLSVPTCVLSVNLRMECGVAGMRRWGRNKIIGQRWAWGKGWW